jgi:hypothetical protein
MKKQQKMLIEMNGLDQKQDHFIGLYCQIIFYAYKHRLDYLIFPDKLKITIHNLSPYSLG